MAQQVMPGKVVRLTAILYGRTDGGSGESDFKGGIGKEFMLALEDFLDHQFFYRMLLSLLFQTCN